ncbi:TolC family protein [Tunturiibacter empetritectus]|uniref:TolC family protein n=1 Tax=Tunturiibacter empetritectus TaxID=3069691 RepID=UPI003D9B4A80
MSSYDPALTGTFSIEHYAQPLSNTIVYGVPQLQQNTTTGNVGYAQAFPTGTSISAVFDNSRGTTNSPESFLVPTLNSYYHFAIQQQLLAGFGLGPNLRFLRIAKNNQRISDEAFKLQVVTTVTQIANMYWDLVAAYEDEGVKNRSLEFARQALESGRKQLALQAIPAMDVMKDEAEEASREAGPDDCEDDVAVSGVADQECADEESGRSDSGGDAGAPDRSEYDGEHDSAGSD